MRKDLGWSFLESDSGDTSKGREKVETTSAHGTVEKGGTKVQTIIPFSREKGRMTFVSSILGKDQGRGGGRRVRGSIRCKRREGGGACLRFLFFISNGKEGGEIEICL